MRRPASLALSLALGCAAAFALTACGGSEDAKLLPGAAAREITENLDAVKQLASEGECVGAANEAQEVSAQVETLSGVDPKLKRALEAGTARLNEVVAGCEEEVSTEPVEPPTEETTTEAEERLPPGQEKKAEKEREHEEKQREKEEEQQEEQGQHEQPPAETPPAEPPTTPAPPSEGGGGTGGPGGVGPGEPAQSGGE